MQLQPAAAYGFWRERRHGKILFGFGHGHLANFWQWQFRSAPSSEGITQQHEQWAQMASQIGTNEVRQLAENWLANLGVDVATLDRKHPCHITQKFFNRNSIGGLKPLDRAKVKLPIFEISWGSILLRGHPQYSFPAVTMTFFGPTKELIEYHLLDDSLMLQPKLLDMKRCGKTARHHRRRFRQIQRRTTQQSGRAIHALTSQFSLFKENGLKPSPSRR